MTVTASPLRRTMTPLRWLRTALHGRLQAAVWRIMHDRAAHRGIPLWLHFRAPENARDTIAQALDRIAQVDPVSFAHIPKALPGGIIADATNYAHAWYSIPRKACVIGAHALAEDTTDTLALCILHEMCHARLWDRGIGYDGKDLRARVDESHYSDDSFDLRHRQELLQKLRLMRDMDTPRWLRRRTILRTRAKLRAWRAASARGGSA